MANKKKSQYPVIDGSAITSLTRFDLLHAGTNAMVLYGTLSGLDGERGLLQKLHDDLFEEWQTKEIDANVTEYIPLLASSSYRFFIVEYAAERNGRYRGGRIMVLNDGTFSYASDMAIDTHDDPESRWMDVSLKTHGNPVCMIEIKTNNIDSEKTYIVYKIVTKIPVHG